MIAKGAQADETGIRHALAFGVSQSGRPVGAISLSSA